MSANAGWRGSCAVGLLVVATTALACARAEPPERILLIVIDTLRRDHLGSYGGDVETPHMDALAARGQVFSRALASFHQTSMSMAALFTGRTPSLDQRGERRSLPFTGGTWCGLRRFAADDADACIPKLLPTLAERLDDAGYWTIGVTSNHFLFDPSGYRRGFDDWAEVGLDPEGRTAAQLLAEGSIPARAAPRVTEAVVAALARRPAGRLFLYVHLMDVHDYFDRPYATLVESVDEAVGDLLEAFSPGDDSLVVLTSDHGERLGERHAIEGKESHYGNPSFQEVLEVPLVVAPPIARDPHRFLRSEDVHDLILEAVGVEPARDAELAPDELYLSEARYRTYLRGSWKSAIDREHGTHHLFDLAKDPGETRDVAAEHTEIVAAHARRIGELAAKLSAEAPGDAALSDDDRARLQALGYLEEAVSP